jgi:hypothetical protein
MAAMRTILDEVVAHLRMLHMASGITADEPTAANSAPAAEKNAVRSPRTPKSRSRKSPQSVSATRSSKVALNFGRIKRGGGDGSSNGVGVTTEVDDDDDDDDDNHLVPSTSPARGRSRRSGSSGSGGSGSGGGGGDRDGSSPASFASSSLRLSGALVLSSLEHSHALVVLREAEENEAAMRAKWGLFCPKHPRPGTLDTDGEPPAPYREPISAGLAAVGSEGVDGGTTRGTTGGGVSAGTSARAGGTGVSTGGADAAPTAASVAAAIAARSLATAGVTGAAATATATQATMDEDTVARVWEARAQFLRYQSLLDDAAVSDGDPDGGFSPTEVNEEVAERLLDALLTDVARELSEACDEATHIVLQQEFSGGGGGGSGGAPGNGNGGGGYGAGGSLMDDDVLGAAIERAYL